MIGFFTKIIGSVLVQAGTNLVSTTTLASVIWGAAAGGILGYATTNADNREIQDMARGIKPIRTSDRPLLERHIQNIDETPGKRALKSSAIGALAGLASLIVNRIFGVSLIICVFGEVIRPFLERYIQNGDETPGKRALAGAAISALAELLSLIKNRIFGMGPITCVILRVIRPLLERHIQNGDETPNKRALAGTAISALAGLLSLIENRIFGASPIICIIGGVISAVFEVQKARPFLVSPFCEKKPQCLATEVAVEETETETVANADTVTDASTTK
ncbi:MAG: hypothetical protein LBF42_01795 [Puniceicoccales bacterium]|jgi:hypothetical protein|nr:hypothetical protein [Puniceicoccales bacterium]